MITQTHILDRTASESSHCERSEAVEIAMSLTLLFLSSEGESKKTIYAHLLVNVLKSLLTILYQRRN